MISTTTQGQVRIMTLDRSEKRNALTPDMLHALTAAIDAADADGSVRAILVAGAGKAFCAGFDLALCKQSPDGTVMRALLTGLSTAIARMRSSPKGVVIAAHARAVAGGCALLGGADLVVADRAASLGYPVLRIGVSPAVSAAFLRLGVGDGACRARLLDTQLISAQEAYRLGLVHELVDAPEGVRPRAMELAATLAEKPGEAIAATKRLLAEVADAPGAGAGLAASLGLTGGPEERERLAALKI